MRRLVRKIRLNRRQHEGDKYSEDRGEPKPSTKTLGVVCRPIMLGKSPVELRINENVGDSWKANCCLCLVGRIEKKVVVKFVKVWVFDHLLLLVTRLIRPYLLHRIDLPSKFFWGPRTIFVR